MYTRSIFSLAVTAFVSSRQLLKSETPVAIRCNPIGSKLP